MSPILGMNLYTVAKKKKLKAPVLSAIFSYFSIVWPLGSWEPVPTSGGQKQPHSRGLICLNSIIGFWLINLPFFI